MNNNSHYSQKILIVDSHFEFGINLQNSIKSEGFFCDVVTGAVQAVQAFQSELYDFVLADFHLPDISGIEFMFWLQKNYTSVKMLIMSDIESAEIETFALESGASAFFFKPFDISELKKRIIRSSRSFSGKINRIGLIDLVQIMQLDSFQKKKLVIEEQTTKEKLKLYIDKGKLVHAVLEQGSETTIGENAFYKALSFKKGCFHQKEWTTPSEESITIPFQALSMKATQHLDEHLEQNTANHSQNKNYQIHNILVVDDEPLICVLFSKVLRHHGYSVNTANSGLAAIELLKNNSFDLIITDLMMPEISGAELITWLLHNNISCPVILISAASTSEIAKISQDNTNVLRYLSKPVSLKELITYLNQISTSGFQGLLKDIGLIDFIQMNLFAGDRKCLEIRDTQSLVTAWLCIQKGRLVHAEYDQLQGETAFEKIVHIERGVFFERPWTPPKTQSLLNISPHKLMMKASLQNNSVRRNVEITDEVYENIERKLKTYSAST